MKSGMEAMAEECFKDLAELTAKTLYPDPNKHEHTHSLYTHCLACYSWGIDFPSSFISAAICGNCGSSETVKYYPSCCMLEAFNQGKYGPEYKSGYQNCGYCGISYGNPSQGCSNYAMHVSPNQTATREIK